VEHIGNTKVLIKKIPWIGSVLKIQRGSAQTSLDELDKIAKKHNALLVAIEPDIKTEDPNYYEFEKYLETNGYRNLDLVFSPTKTTYIDLSQNENDILMTFDKDLRKGLKHNQNKNIRFRKIDDLDEFYRLLTATGHRRHVFVQNLADWKNKWGSFGDNLNIITAEMGGKLLGGNMFITTESAGFGLFLPTTESGRKNRVAASLIWEGMKIAKERGCTRFDLNGMYDDRYKLPRRWKGLTAFKRKFKGHEVEFMHPKVKLYNSKLKVLERLGLLWIFFNDTS